MIAGVPIVGIPKEIKPQEGRVAQMPEQVQQLTAAGVKLLVETNAGLLSGVSDADYKAVGAEIMPDAACVYDQATLIVKVKELLETEYPLLREDHILLTNFHPAATPDQVDHLLETGLTAIAVEDCHEFGSPNSALAGEVGAFEAIHYCLAPHGGSGRHFHGHYGSQPLKAAVIGLGNVGRGALRVLLPLGVEVVGYDISDGIRYRSEQDWPKSNFASAPVEDFARDMGCYDLIVNCVLWPKHRDDHLISRSDLKRLKPGAVISDIACDPGGAVETCRTTKWDAPTYREEGILHFCVDNIPGAVPIAASAGYSRALYSHIKSIIENGWQEACRKDPYLARGLVCAAGILPMLKPHVFRHVTMLKQKNC